jgi:hypothetical protein
MSATSGVVVSVSVPSASSSSASTAKGGVLKEHTVTLEKNSTAVRFRSYYNSGTLVHYELLPLACYMGFVEPASVIDSIPSGWVCSVGQFDDGTLFGGHNIPPETLFGEQAAIGFLCSRLGSKGEVLSRTLQDQCLRRIESDRVRLADGQLVELRRQIAELGSRLDRTVKESHDAFEAMFAQFAGLQLSVGKAMRSLRAL